MPEQQCLMRELIAFHCNDTLKATMTFGVKRGCEAFSEAPRTREEVYNRISILLVAPDA